MKELEWHSTKILLQILLGEAHMNNLPHVITSSNLYLNLAHYWAKTWSGFVKLILVLTNYRAMIYSITSDHLVVLDACYIQAAALYVKALENEWISLGSPVD